MEKSLMIDVLECSMCFEEINSGSQIYIICPQCAGLIVSSIVEPQQLTLFELPQPSEIH